MKPELRGQGKGQQILNKVIEHYQGQSLVMDIESTRQESATNIEIRKRRHDFYLRNGFRETKLFRAWSGIEYTILMIGEGRFFVKDWDDIIADLKRYWSWESKDKSTHRLGPGILFAQNYMKDAKLPLTANDLAIAFDNGVKYGKGSFWHRIGEQSPNPNRINAQVVVVVGLPDKTFDLDVITPSEYPE